MHVCVCVRVTDANVCSLLFSSVFLVVPSVGSRLGIDSTGISTVLVGRRGKIGMRERKRGRGEDDEEEDGRNVQGEGKKTIESLSRVSADSFRE